MTEIKNLKKAAKRILSSCKKNERIILFGDADLDGATSVIILEETIKNLGRTPFLYFPEREIEGYGLQETALKILAKYAPGLLILLDCGIGNFKEIEKAKKMGFEVIIIEHHEILNNIPKASIVVNPKQKSDKYPFKLLATCGIVFKLAKILLGTELGGGRVAFNHLEQSFLELVALGTLADMMPQVEDNQVFIEKGLNSLPSTFRPGLQAILKKSTFPGVVDDAGEHSSLREIVSKIIPVLQITDSRNHLTESYLLLSSQNEKKANQLLKKLLEKSNQRQELIRELTDEICQKVAKFPGSVDAAGEYIIFEGGVELPLALTGAVASRICNKFKKPTFIFNSNKNFSRGSVRTPKQINSVEALKHCSSLLEVYGGHPPASGFTCKNKNLDKLKQCLTEYFAKNV